MTKTTKTICVLGPRPRVRKTELGEGAGHPFRGNQHTGGLGGIDELPGRHGALDDGSGVYDAANAWAGDVVQTDMIQTAADAQVMRGEFLHSSNGSTAGMAEAMIRGVQNAPPNPQSLYRGIMVESVPSYKEGEAVNFSLGSFSANPLHAEDFARGMSSSGEGVLFHIDPGDTRALDLQPFTPVAEQEREYVTGGSFQVTDVDPASTDNDWLTSVGLKQTATPDVK